MQRRLAGHGSFIDQAEPIFCWYLVARASAGAPHPSESRNTMTAKTRFRGSFTALVTPFKNGSVDEKAFRDLVDWQIAEGTNGLVPVGTTGESPTLSPQGARAGRGMVRGPGQGPRSRDRGRGLELDRRGGQPVEARREGRRRRRAGGDALLQQADPGRALPALQGDQRRHRHPDHHVQHSGPLDRRHQRRYDEAAL